MLKKSSGHFNLFLLLDFIAKNPKLPPFLERSERKISTPYKRVIDQLLKCSEVPEDKGGWYLWGKFNDAAWWETVYVGKTGHGRTSNLYTRLFDELREECAALFAAVYGWDAVMTALNKKYKNHKAKGGKDYSGSIQRSLRKRENKFIIWAAAPAGMSEVGIRRIESALIYLYRPAFNSKRPDVSKYKIFNDIVIKKVNEEIGREIREMRGEFKI